MWDRPTFDTSIGPERVVLRPALMEQLSSLFTAAWMGALATKAAAGSRHFWLWCGSLVAVSLLYTVALLRASVVYDCDGVTIRRVRRRTIPWDDIGAIGVSWTSDLAMAVMWRARVRPVLRLRNRRRVRLPIAAGWSRQGDRPARHVEFTRQFIEAGQRFGGRTLHVQSIDWEPS